MNEHQVGYSYTFTLDLWPKQGEEFDLMVQKLARSFKHSVAARRMKIVSEPKLIVRVPVGNIVTADPYDRFASMGFKAMAVPMPLKEKRSAI